MKRYGLFFVLACLMAYCGRDGARAQQTTPVTTPQPNCIIQFSFTAAGSSAVLDNRQVGCITFTVAVNVPTTIGGLSLVVQTAPFDGSTNCSTCTWSTFAAATGSNPTTSTAGSNATFTTGTANYYDFLRVTLSSVSGTGTIQGKLYGAL